jgi:hypothetical protein
VEDVKSILALVMLISMPKFLVCSLLPTYVNFF